MVRGKRGELESTDLKQYPERVLEPQTVGMNYKAADYDCPAPSGRREEVERGWRKRETEGRRKEEGRAEETVDWIQHAT